MSSNHRGSPTRKIALTVIFASLYVALGYALHPISFLQVQVRVADALYPLIAVFGAPSLIGLIIGHFIVNLSSPLGLIDLLSIPLFIPAKLAIWKWGINAVWLHILSVGIWVSIMLQVVIGLGFWLSFPLVLTGEFIAEYVLGVPLALAIERRLQ